MSFEDRVIELTDARSMRALAHPTRMAIIDFLSVRDEATATQCAEAVGESPSACSFHLRALARWGLVEDAPGGKGRNRPWRLAAKDIRWSSATSSSPAFLAAERALTDHYIARDQHYFSNYLRREHDLPTEWREAALFSRANLVMTTDELKVLGEALLKLYEPYLAKNRKQPPEEARQIYAMFRAFPRVES